MRATAKDLRFKVKELLETVSRGEEVVITHRGKDCAKLVPVDGEGGQEDELFGIWQNDETTADVNEHVRSLRKRRSNAD